MACRTSSTLALGRWTEHAVTPLGVWLLRLGIRSHAVPRILRRWARTALPPHAEGRAGRSALRRSRALPAAFEASSQLPAPSGPRPGRPAARSDPARVPSPRPCRPSSTRPNIRSAASRTKAASASRARSSNCPRHAGYPVGLVPTTHDGTWKVIFASRQIAQLDMRDGTVKTVTHVSEHL